MSTTATDTRRRLIARIPTPVFVIGYGALVLAVVVALAMLASYHADASEGAGNKASSPATTADDKSPAAPTTPPGQQDPKQPWNPPPRDEDNVRASVRDYLITDVETGVRDTGVMLRGTTTAQAEADTADFSGHLSRLLLQNCLDTVVLTTPDNMRISFLGFCFSTLEPETIEPYIATALEEDVDSVAFVNYNSRAGVEVALNWLDVASTSQLDDLETTWRHVPLRPGLERVRFTAYTEDTVMAGHRTRGESIAVFRGDRFTTSG